jgi:hypothetical protein
MVGVAALEGETKGPNRPSFRSGLGPVLLIISGPDRPTEKYTQVTFVTLRSPGVTDRLQRGSLDKAED